jgi:hypothetical protein
MKPARTLLFLFLFVSVCWFSCKKDNELHYDAGYGYSPTDVGRYVIYDVDSVIYNAFNHDTIHYKYQLKEYLQSVFPDNEGRPSLRIERSVRAYSSTLPYDSIPWVLKNVWYSTRTPTDFERVEDNVRYVRLSFPTVNFRNWNGNAQNTLGDWEYAYNGTDQKLNVNGLHFDSTLTVNEHIDTNLLTYQVYTELYAKNVGLISRQVIDVSANTIVPGVSVLNRINNGVVCNATVHSYGRQ